MVKLRINHHRGQRGNILRQRRKRLETDQEPPLDPAKARQQIFQRAAKLLAAKQRSVEELRARLLASRGGTTAIVDEVIALKLPVLWLQETVVHEEAAEKARKAGIKVVMDLCILKEHRARRDQL